MGFSNEWEDIYKNNEQLSLFPWSDLVSYVMRYCKPNKTPFKVLEIGCGAGANIPFFISLKNVEYFGIDGSKTIINKLHLKYPGLINRIVSGDFTESLIFEEQFDLIVDRAAITHNNTPNIIKTINLIDKKLNSGGCFIGIDWFSILHSDYKFGIKVFDQYTKSHSQNGQFKNIGEVHFSDETHLRYLFKKFKIEILEEKIINKVQPQENFTFASWNLLVKKHE